MQHRKLCTEYGVVPVCAVVEEQGKTKRTNDKRDDAAVSVLSYHFERPLDEEEGNGSSCRGGGRRNVEEWKRSVID